ncbi:Cof-type HAD-IIB family hydrolase [Lapidilactobacillus mulanensis]|uniref:Cof-type HAD-IIB family hydrolase n=1 Tax=Lapidilactobacillus mulanensis TaxID=2485999 RepID=A0ABW4DNI3_9LACO|nr:Cof-type HAD-IIB family hydrolase [Lapidilactobacillus mulanensis]
MTKKLIALDLDGTTLNNQSKISPRTAEILKKAEDAGNIVTIATGRPNRISENFYHDLHLQSPMVNFNGGLIHVPDQQWVGEKGSTIPRDLVFDVLKLKKDLPIRMVAAEGKNFLFADQIADLNIEFFPTVLKSNQILNEQSLKTNPTSLTIFVDNQDQDYIKTVLKQKYPHIELNSWGGQVNALEIVHEGINKFEGVQYVADYFNIPVADIIAFGDEQNDREMLTNVGWGVAMANGAPAIKSLAKDVTTLTNDQDGLADYLAHYLAI